MTAIHATERLKVEKAAGSCGAYVGGWGIRGDKVIHHIGASLNPDWVGTAQERNATLDGDRLTLSPPTDQNGTTARISWQRVSR